MTKILGIDCSSQTIGYSVLEVNDKDIKFIKCGYIKPSKKGPISERLAKTRDEVKNLIDTVKPDVIGIEEIIQFMQGKSTAKTIIMLTTFNRMVCLLAYDYLGKSPELFNIMSIRHGLKIGSELPKKEEIPDLVAKHLEITFPYEYNKKNAIKVESYDKADGTAVGLYYAFILTGKKVRKVKK